MLSTVMRCQSNVLHIAEDGSNARASTRNFGPGSSHAPDITWRVTWRIAWCGIDAAAQRRHEIVHAKGLREYGRVPEPRQSAVRGVSGQHDERLGGFLKLAGDGFGCLAAEIDIE